MKVLITGGTGFQGSHLAEHLYSHGWDVTLLNTYSQNAERNLSEMSAWVTSNITVVWGSITDRELVRKTVRDHEFVVHLAARKDVDESIEFPYEYMHVNTFGTMNILEAVREFESHLLYVSSCEVYGDDHYQEMLTSWSPLQPNSPYAASKASAEMAVSAYRKTYKVQAIIARPVNIFGERQRDGVYGNLIPIFRRLARENSPLTIYGNGEQSREYLHVREVCDAYAILLDKGFTNRRNYIYNISSTQSLSVKEIARLVQEQYDVEVVHLDARPGEVHKFMLHITPISQLGWRGYEIDVKDRVREYLNE